jgi:hypothetical protein
MTGSFDPCDPAALSLLEEWEPRRRPWSLLLTGRPGISSTAAAETLDTAPLVRIFELMPGLPALELQFADGGRYTVQRDFPSGYLDEVDRLLGSLFRQCPQLTGVRFQQKGAESHTATPDAPYWHPEGKRSAESFVAYKRGEITLSELRARLDLPSGSEQGG